MLQITFSNRFERLQDALLDALARPPQSPFDAQQVIVPSAAVRRRVELAAAERFGICANARCEFLAQWLWRQIGHVVPVAEISPFTAPAMTWRVLAILDDAAFVGVHPRLAAYLGRADAVMRYELAGRIASLLELYLAYRPDWLAAWLDRRPAGIGALDGTAREDERWQGELWRRIATALGTDRRHPSVAFFDALAAMGPGAPGRAGLPAAAHVFCLPATPPLYLKILHGLARWIDLRLYVLNPCREYWLEVVEPRRLAYLAAARRAEHHEVGNALLAAWGRQTQAHVDLLLGDEGPSVDDAIFERSAGASLLAQVQNAILDLTDPPRGAITVAPGDRSIEVHVCHSTMRELEVLQDQLLALFAGPDPPRPSDILVVMPDLEAAAPLIEAVFGNAPPGCAIPYAITGRPASALDPCARALLGVLAVATSRVHASAVYELLLQPVIARRFGIDDAALEAIHGWIRDAGIRWGLDERHRVELGLPGTGRHAFADGLDRLFLGYALPADAVAALNERLPAGEAEGSAALALGGFAAFVRRLERLHRALREPRTAAAWRVLLLDVLERFLAPEGDEIDDARDTAAGIHALCASIERGAPGTALPVEVVRTALQGALDEPTRGGTPTGAVTFAAMASLRGLPYRVVCVLGLNDGVFPSTGRADEFDLVALAPRRGDRQRRTDERNLFLDLVLAARERLVLSYTGRSVRDNSPLPPSVLVAELLDYCAAATDTPPFSAASRARARARLIVEHPLQAFSVEYFTPDADPRRRSFDAEYCAALKERLAATPSGAPASAAGPAPADEDEPAQAPQARFFAGALAPAGPELREVTLETLARFFRNPCRHLLRTRLGIVLPEGDEELEDDEPFVPDLPARRALAARLLPPLLAGAPAEEVRALARAGTEYPSGPLGERALDGELARLDRFAQGLARRLAAPALPPVAHTLELPLDGEIWRLAGGFGDLRAGGLVRYRYDDTRARDYLNGWIEHLFLNTIAPPGAECRTTWHSRDGDYALRPVAPADARGHIETLLRLYREGLHQPLRFFPRAAWMYVTAGESLSKAGAAWRSARFRPHGEDRDAAYRLALRGVDDPLDEAFVACAKAVFAPLLGAIDDPRLEAHE